jgi:NAD(P)-dependent dehydrogenase (short-subunit alcohol dehydrogenase family)
MAPAYRARNVVVLLWIGRRIRHTVLAYPKSTAEFWIGTASKENAMRRSLEDKIAVVTGGAGGVGLGIAREFVEQGASVVITGRREAPLDEAVAALGPACSAFKADVACSEDMDALYTEVMRRHGRLDAVIANAGLGDSAPFGSIREEQFDRIFDVNVKGVLFTAQKALPLLSRTGTIVIIGSTASIDPPAGMSMYGGAKAAVRNFVRGWIQDIKGMGVRVNVLSPGAVDTPSLRIALEDASGPEQVDALVQAMGEDNPIGRLADPTEVGKAAVFLSSDASSYITGVELFVDGGLAQV